MKAEAKRLYVVGGSKRVQQAELTSFNRRGEIEVVRFDLPTETPLSGFRDAKKKKAQIAVVNMGRHEEDSGSSGEEVVGSLVESVPRFTVITFSLDSPSAKIPEAHAHVQMRQDLLEESVEELTEIICNAPLKVITISPGEYL